MRIHWLALAVVPSIHGWVVVPPILLPSSSSCPSSTCTRTRFVSTSRTATGGVAASTALHLSANANVVLRPSSDDPTAFDSYKVGSPRVHRYDSNSDDTAQYVMWYHGRSQQFPNDDSLPPLSTGRIGRATSYNGLVWEKSKQGSESEDVSDVSLGLNKDSWWGFDTAHVGLGQVMLPMNTPAVMSDQGVYIMYYMGGDGNESPISNYVKDVDSNDTIRGMQMKIGVAVSQDGISWGRVEGDDPTGACMVPYDVSDPNHASMFDERSPFTTMDEELYCAWPEVVVHTDPDVEVTEGTKEPGFYMYYSTMRKSDKQKCLAVAISADGFRWFKEGICVQPDESGLDAGGCARCCVIRNAEFDQETSTWSNVEGWTMFYEGVSVEDGKHRIMTAESKDGMQWEKRGLAMDVGESEDAWDFMGVGSPHVLRLDDGSLRMYYTGQGSDGTAIGVAKFDTSAGAWTREQAEFSFAT